ncbi:hypothetical protein GZH49_39770 [Nocardia terpenica]
MVEVVDINRCGGYQLLQLPFPGDRAAPIGDDGLRGVVGGSNGLDDGLFPQAVAVPATWERQHRISGIEVALTGRA